MPLNESGVTGEECEDGILRGSDLIGLEFELVIGYFSTAVESKLIGIGIFGFLVDAGAIYDVFDQIPHSQLSNE